MSDGQTESTPATPAVAPAKHLKPGWQTTEFWISAFSTIASIGGALAGIVPGRVGVISGAVASGAYAISRGLAKQG